MAGIYIHIPFCKKACHYCDFHFSTSLQYKDDMLKALKKELTLQQSFLEGQRVETIYFGGGTPSILAADDIQKLLDHIQGIYPVTAGAEITLEANPDDLDALKVQGLRQTDVNRFSIGIQSFYDEDLRWMNRAHNASEAESSVKRIQDAGFENITLDLIYGYPLLSDEKWKSNNSKVLELGVPHLSSYSMTVEPSTALDSFIRRGKQQPMNESQSAAQFLYLINTLQDGGFEQYEISNFAHPGKHSRHNSNYWKGVPYLGIGPSAHSFNGNARQWNVANNAKYMAGLETNTIPAEVEILSLENRINEYIMTSLRTMWGMDLERIESEFGSDYHTQIINGLKDFSEKQWILTENNVVKLTTEGKLYADHIAASLFVEPEEKHSA